MDWAPAERESFFRAIQRHRRAAWRVSAASTVANCSVAFVVAILMAPLLFAALCLAFDLVNLLIPAPNLVTAIGSLYRSAVSHPGQLQWTRSLGLLLGAAAPGLLWMALVVRMLSRVLRVAASVGPQMQVRAARLDELTEQRFVDVIEEMAIAAGLPRPEVRLTSRQMLNAAVLGQNEHSAVIIVSESVLATLSRQEMQGVAAHLVATVADGDLAIGQRIAVTIGLFGLMARFSSVLNEDDGFRKLWRLLLALRSPGSESGQPLIQEISDPFGSNERRRMRRSRVAQESQVATDEKPRKESNWRLWLWAPLAGPVVMSGFFAGFVSVFVLRPLVALAWRQRKYMADAIAVRLTRDPDALAGALGRMGAGDSFAPWLAHLSVVGAQKPGEVLGSSVVPMFPSQERRLRALRRMGAHVVLRARRPLDWRVYVFAAPLVLLLVSLLALVMVMLAYVSIPMSALFTGIPFAVLHLLLRALGH